MSIAVVMPQLGLTMEEGTVSAWLKKTGDSVKKDELLFSVSTDKVEMDVESAAEGILSEIIQPAGSTIPVGTVLAYIKGPGAGSVAADQPAATHMLEQKNSAAIRGAASADTALNSNEGGGSFAKPGSRRLASPRAKRRAAELGVDWSGVQKDNPDGQVTEQDILHAASREKPPSHPSRPGRRLLAERLTRSIQTIPSFSVAAEANAENLIALHQSLKASRKESSGKVTVTDLLLSVFAAALKSCPEMNAIWQENEVRHQASVDIGLAVATAQGVAAPIIRNVEVLDLLALAHRRSAAVEKARTGRLSLADLEGGVGTLSNLGMYRVDHFQAIISPGQSAILAVGQIRERPWADKTLTVKPTLMLNLTVDHRLADGAAAAVLLGRMIELIEARDVLPGKFNGFPRQAAGRESNG